MDDPTLFYVSQLMNELGEEKVLTTKAVVAAEYVDEDGQRWLRMAISADVKNWEIRGMLSEILSDIDAYDVREAVWDEEED